VHLRSYVSSLCIYGFVEFSRERALPAELMGGSEKKSQLQLDVQQRLVEVGDDVFDVFDADG
jgi:hypothetical protein